MKQRISITLDSEAIEKKLMECLKKGFDNPKIAFSFITELLENTRTEETFIKMLSGFDIICKYKPGDKVLLPYSSGPSWRYKSNQEELLFKNCFRAVVNSVSMSKNTVNIQFSYFNDKGELYSDEYEVAEYVLSKDHTDLENDIDEFLSKS